MRLININLRMHSAANQLRCGSQSTNTMSIWPFIRNVYLRHVKCTSKVQKWRISAFNTAFVGRYSIAVENRKGVDVSSLERTIWHFSSHCLSLSPPSVAWMLYGMANPAKTSQYDHTEECSSERMGDCDPCYGTAELHEGSVKRNRA